MAVQTLSVHQLEEVYSFRNAMAVKRFLRDYPQLVEILSEAPLHLQKHFGPDPQVTLSC